MPNWIMEAQADAVQKVRVELAKPDTEEDFAHSESFDPWELFPSLYGIYDKAFDDCAIEVLTGLLSEPPCWDRDDFGAQMFREILCTSDLCEYGTSPRVCFPTEAFKEVLPELVARWRVYRAHIWRTAPGGEHSPAPSTA